MKVVAVFLILSVILYNTRALPTSEESDEDTRKPAIAATPRFGFTRPLFCNFRCHIRCFFRGYWTGYCEANSCTCAGNRNPDAGNNNGNSNPTEPDLNLPEQDTSTNGGNDEEGSSSSKLPGFPTLPPLRI